MRRYPDALPAGEIAETLNFKPSTTSVYLSALSREGLIRQTRVGTSRLYALEMSAARAVVDELFFGCCRGRPDLCPPMTVPGGARPDQGHDEKLKVLFVCTGNSTRSILAEALLRHEAGDRFAVYSAGTQPRDRLSPLVLDVLEEQRLETEGLRAKNITEFLTADAPRFDFVFTVCDRAANEDRPLWSGQSMAAHWGLPSFAGEGSSDAQKRVHLMRTLELTRSRVEAFARLPIASLAPAHLQKHLDSIGQITETT